MKYLALPLLFLLLLSCSDKKETATASTTTPEVAETAPTTAPQDNTETTTAVIGQPFPSIGQPMMQKLWNECNHIDYAFTSEKIPYSMSVDDKNSIQQMLRLVAVDPAVVRPDCESIGKIYFQKDGINMMEADFYFFGEGCTYLVFYENKKPKYANYLTQEGVAYYNQFFAQAAN